jgi:nephrocystin-3
MPAADRSIRVFISSTFRDMQAERDELVKRVFPHLRKLCEDRGVTFTEVDLRWGVTEEDASEGRVLPICLAEIERCRPFFIGLLGERYGWVPQRIPDELIERQPWLAEHGQKSVTELEILYGVVNNPEMASRASFYFRDPAYVDGLPTEQRKEFREQDPQRRARLAALKEQVRQGAFACRENYPNPQTLGKWVLEDLTAVIDQLFPASEVLDPLDREAAEHEAFARSRTGVYLGFPEYLALLDRHAAGDGPPLVVLGESGCGKSALLANWAMRYRDAQPQALVLTHFVAATPDSADWGRLLRRIMGELKRRFQIPHEIPDQPEALRAAFGSWLHLAAAQGRVVLVLDGLNQLEDRDKLQNLHWLPALFPANVRLIASTVSDRYLEELQKRGWPTTQLRLLEYEERLRLLEAVLGQHAKRLSRKQAEYVARAPAAANPLFLRILLEELRLHGEHFSLDQRIAHYLKAPTIEDLYGRILERYEQDYGRERPGLVRDALSLLWAARRGLAEAELLDLLGTDEQRLPQSVWSPLHLAVEKSLVSRSGLLGFSHDYLRRAVVHRYLPAPPDREAAHQRLADYFRQRTFTRRTAEEVPWQLAQARSWTQLSEWLSDPESFLGTTVLGSWFDVRLCWTQIEACSPLRMVPAYRRFLDQPALIRLADQSVLRADAQSLYFTAVAGLFHSFGHLPEAQELYARTAHHAGSQEVETVRRAAQAQEALLKLERGDLDGALHLARDQESRSRAANDVAALVLGLRVQAVVLESGGELDAALALCREIEPLARQLADKARLAEALVLRARILRTRSFWTESLTLLEEAERVVREAGRRDLLGGVLEQIGVLLADRHDYRGALALFRQKESVCHEVNDQEGLAACWGNQAACLRECGDLKGALKLLKQQEALARRLGNRQQLAGSLGGQANIHCDLADHAAGLTLFKDQERICRELGLKDSLALCLGNQADCFRARREYQTALALVQEQESLSRELGNRRQQALSLLNQSLLLFNHLGNKAEALSRCEQALGLFRELGIAPDILQAQAVLKCIQLGITQRMGRIVAFCIPLGVLLAGLALSLLVPRLWWVGGLFASIGAVTLGLAAALRFLPSLKFRHLGWIRQHVAAAGTPPDVGRAPPSDANLPVDHVSPPTGPPAPPTIGVAAVPESPTPPNALPEPLPTARPAAPTEAPSNAPSYPRVERNALCPCGSGKKYGRCHGMTRLQKQRQKERGW